MEPQKNEFPKLVDFYENLIALTSGQHLQAAHPNGNTSLIDKQYQYTCLIAKTASISQNLLENNGEPTLYNFQDFMQVLDIGLSTDYFGYLDENDFSNVISGIEFNFERERE